MKVLQTLKIPFGKNELNWEMQFYELQKFKKRYGHCDVPFIHKNKRNRSLAAWCKYQRLRQNYSPLKYSPYRLNKLNELGFCWNVFDKLFESKFRQLKQYHKKNGHCNVSKPENLPLAGWCSAMRLYRKRNMKRLTKEKIERLTELGFEWHSIIEQENKLRWEKQFALLNEYKREYGHCNVSLSQNDSSYRSLAKWVIRQRKNYKSKLLTLERIAKLNSVGFNWINPLKPWRPQKFNDEDLLNELRRLYTLRGLPPSIPYINKYGKYSRKAYCNHFGSIPNACKAAGISS
jgi:hypothetical protein